jgi:hypothetical protein
MISYPRADSPIAPFSSDFVPVTAPIAKAATTNASQRTIARQGRRALQLPMPTTERRLRVYAR